MNKLFEEYIIADKVGGAIQVLVICFAAAVIAAACFFLNKWGFGGFICFPVVIMVTLVWILIYISKARKGLVASVSKKLEQREKVLRVLAEGRVGMLDSLYRCEVEDCPVLQVIKEINSPGILREYREYLKKLNEDQQRYISLDLIPASSTGDMSGVGQMKIRPTWQEMIKEGIVPAI